MRLKNLMSLSFAKTLSLAVALLFTGCSDGEGDAQIDRDAGAANVGSAIANTQSPKLRASDLAAPVRLKAGGEYIDAKFGHAAPYLADINGDSKRDLLVGQFGGGKLNICLNVGTDINPDYEAPVYFKAGGEIARVETG